MPVSSGVNLAIFRPCNCFCVLDTLLFVRFYCLTIRALCSGAARRTAAGEEKTHEPLNQKTQVWHRQFRDTLRAKRKLCLICIKDCPRFPAKIGNTDPRQKIYTILKASSAKRILQHFRVKKKKFFWAPGVCVGVIIIIVLFHNCQPKLLRLLYFLLLLYIIELLRFTSKMMGRFSLS